MTLKIHNDDQVSQVLLFTVQRICNTPLSPC